MSDVGKMALAARVFTIAALTSLAALAGPAYLSGASLVVLTAAGALALAYWTSVPEWVVALVEGCVVAVIAVLTYPASGTVTPYLVIPALIAGLDLGGRGLWRVVGAEFGVLILTWLLWAHSWDRAVLADTFTWLATALGIGLIGVALRRAVLGNDSDASYRSAVALIRRLDVLSGKLSGGLDAVGLAEQAMAEADRALGTRAAAIYVRTRGGELTPLRYAVGTSPQSVPWAEELAERSWRYGSMVLQDDRAALPARAGDEVIAVLVVETLRPIDPYDARPLGAAFEVHGVQLQAALLFSRVRESATSQERQRIAREMHDGVAQDVASLGYLVDNLADSAVDPDQLAQIAQLRQEVTRVVGELRHSVFDLRQELPKGAGLGESLSAYANRVASLSPMAVHVTVDEEGPRLPHDVEFELLRIAQEAMANARKHSDGANLWLRCTVRSPYAEIEVGDDGTRQHDPAEDSQGLRIMRERSSSIGADFVIEAPTPERPGTRVRVRVGASAR